MAEPTIDREIELAAGNLPEGWIIKLMVERGAAWIEAVCPDGERWSENEMELSPDDSLAHRINCVVDFCIYRHYMQEAGEMFDAIERGGPNDANDDE